MKQGPKNSLRPKKGLRAGCYLVPKEYLEKIRSEIKNEECDWSSQSLSGVDDKDEFLRLTAKTLNFPDYFGGNLDALEDCLGEIHFSKSNKRVICFTDSKDLRDDKLVFSSLKNVFSSVASDLEKDGKLLMVLFVE